MRRPAPAFTLAPVLCLTLAAFGCAGGDDQKVDEGGQDVSASTAHPQLPHFDAFGGSVIKKPKLVAVTFTGDTKASKLENFVSTLATSDFWKQSLEDYVGPATAGSPIRLPSSLPANMTDDDLAEFVASKVFTPAKAAGNADENTMFVLYTPSATKITRLGMKTCDVFLGYHSQTKVAGKPIAYAVVPRCSDDFDTLTTSTFHELAEAATNPFNDDKPGFRLADDFFALGYAIRRNEVADVCEDAGEIKVAELGGAVVMPIWSNTLARAGHQPCAPVSGPYFNSVPVADEPVRFTHTYPNGEVRGISAKGIRVPLGQTRTVDVHLFSDGKTSGDWAVKATDAAELRGGDAELSVALDRKTGNNGDTLHLTITPKKKGAEGFSAVSLESKLGTVTNRWAVLVVN
jgi:hypothetical protein